MAFHPSVKKLKGRIAKSGRSKAPPKTKTVHYNGNQYHHERPHQQDLYTFYPDNQDDAYAYEPPYCVPQDDFYNEIMYQQPHYYNHGDYHTNQPNYMLLDPEDDPMDLHNEDHDLYTTGYGTRSTIDKGKERVHWDPSTQQKMKPKKPAKRNIRFVNEDSSNYIQPPPKRRNSQQDDNVPAQAGPSNSQSQMKTPTQSRPLHHTDQQPTMTRHIPEVRRVEPVREGDTQEEIRDTEMAETSRATRISQSTQAGASHTKPKKKRTTREKPIVNYDVIDDVMNRVANITIQDLVKLVPSVRRQLHGATSIRKKPRPNNNPVTLSSSQQSTQNLTLIDDQKRTFESTAAYATFHVCGVAVRALIDTGASMTCISKTFADDIGLKINAPSSARFTLGNATQQASLGIIFDVPLRPGDKVAIPINVEVLGRCPVPLIVGNNWFTRAHAIINFVEKTLSLRVAKLQVSIPITYVKEIIKPHHDQVEKQQHTRYTKLYYSSDSASDTSTEDYPSSDTSSSSSSDTSDDLQEESSDSIYYLEQEPHESIEAAAHTFIENGIFTYGIYSLSDTRIPPGEAELLIGNIPERAAEEMKFESSSVPHATIDRRISADNIPLGETRFSVLIENNHPDDLVIRYGEPLGDFVPEQEINDDDESIVAYEFAPPLQNSTLASRDQDDLSQDLYPMQSTSSRSYKLKSIHKSDFKLYEVWSRIPITIPPRDQVHIYGEFDTPVLEQLQFTPEAGMAPDQYTHKYFGRDVEPGETEFKITIINERYTQLTILAESFVGMYHPTPKNGNHQEKEPQEIEIQPLPQEYRDRITPPDIDDPAIRSDLYNLLSEYQDIFDWSGENLGRTHLMHHKIETEDVQPIRARPYRLAPVEAEALKKELDKLCKLRVIRPSSSPWAAPVILVKKKNGDYRLVVDYRKLNAVTKKDAYPLPRIDDLLDALGNARIFSALDLRSGFNQVPLHPDSIEKTAFVCKEGVYENLVLPQGCANSPRVFQRLVDICLRPLVNKCVVAYIDDINVYSKTPKEHINHLRRTFECLRTANLTLNPDKCVFFKKNLQFLGFIITADGVAADEEKIIKIKNFPQPKTVTQLRSFLGLASFYRKHVPNFARIARPLHNLTKLQDTPWTPKATEAFEQLKTALTTPPVLARPDFDKPFILATDASREGLGAVLSQLDDNNRERPILYLSRGVNKAESNYSISKLELLAAVWAIKQLRSYLLGKKFQLITDHTALRGLLNTPNPNGMLARWIAFLSEFDYDIQYRPGRTHNNADFLSRLGY